MFNKRVLTVRYTVFLVIPFLVACTYQKQPQHSNSAALVCPPGVTLRNSETYYPIAAGSLPGGVAPSLVPPKNTPEKKG